MSGLKNATLSSSYSLLNLIIDIFNELLTVNPPLSTRQLNQLVILGLLIPVSASGLLGALQYYSWGGTVTPMSSS